MQINLTGHHMDITPALRAFVDFQRQDHRAGGTDHQGMDHSGHTGAADHESMH